MNRIDTAHLLWCLDNLALGHVVNAVHVPEAQRHFAKVALDRMLELKAAGGIREMARD
jgi:quinolinate synthase